METYFYELSGGCGSTKINLDFNLTTNEFVMEVKSHWMGSDKFDDVYKGNIIVKNTHQYYLYVMTYNDIDCSTVGIVNNNNSNVSLIFTKLPTEVDIDEHFIEFDGMVMGGCKVNINAKYDSMLTFCIGNGFGAFQPDQNDVRFKNIFYISKHLYPMIRVNIANSQI